jgi:anthranilate synthase component 1
MVIKNGVAHVQAGGGIVADSTPEGEYEESVNKSKALLTALEAAHRRGTERKPKTAQRKRAKK